MSKLPVLSGAELIRILEKYGFYQARQKGSHVILKKKTFDGEVGCVVPLHNHIDLGTLKAILRQARLEVRDVVKM